MPDYALLASSGTYRLPSDPFSDNSIAMASFASHALLALSQSHHFHFRPHYCDTRAWQPPVPRGRPARLHCVYSNAPILERLLGRDTDKQGPATVLAEQQRDKFVRDLYAILFAFVVETINHNLAPSSKNAPPASQIVILDQPGFQTRGASGTPFTRWEAKLHLSLSTVKTDLTSLPSILQRRSYTLSCSDTFSRIALDITIQTMDSLACVEPLSGPQVEERVQRKPGGLLGVVAKACSSFKSGKGDDHRNEDLLQDLATKFGVHASFVASPSVGGQADRTLFGINRYAGQVSYDITRFIEKNADLLDSTVVPLLRNSTEAFVAKLFSCRRPAPAAINVGSNEGRRVPLLVQFVYQYFNSALVSRPVKHELFNSFDVNVARLAPHRAFAHRLMFASSWLRDGNVEFVFISTLHTWCFL
ncbi:hypothetical protein BDZ89DRAFT_1140696 [Hymenopellis radicata]|nr:hypothetical protein BDZ89DRAFT_1140696 [Hymenopellis radicata]